MVHPVSRQDVYSPNAAQPSTQMRAEVSVSSKDILIRANAASFESFSPSAFWNSIVNCFKSVFNYFFKSIHKAQIAKIAAREHFLWFHKKDNSTTAFLSNFHLCPIKIWNLQFQCAEAAFQAAKFSPNQLAMKSFENLDGNAAFRLGSELMEHWTQTARDEWHNTRRLDIMRDVLTEKFTQNAELKELLLATGDAYLVEHSADGFWGDHLDGRGDNWLGDLAMQLRRQLGGGIIQLEKPKEYNQFIEAKWQMRRDTFPTFLNQ